MAGTMERRRRPRGAGSIQWRRGRPYAVYRDALTGKQTRIGFDTEEEADAFLTQWAADRKAARVAAKAARAERNARAPQRRRPSSSDPWTFGQLLTDWEERHRDGVQESTMRDYGPGLNDPRLALDDVLVRSLTEEHFEAYKRAKLDGIDVGGGDQVRKLSAATVSRRLDLAHDALGRADAARLLRSGCGVRRDHRPGREAQSARPVFHRRSARDPQRAQLPTRSRAPAATPCRL
jgi:hypothetical protein